MIDLYADNLLVYNNRLESRKLLSLKTTEGLNKSGTATFTMPPGHVAYNSFVSYKTVVTLYEDGVLRFRGRALYPSDDFYNCRTITCEGERGFFKDVIARPYLYQDTPANIFAQGLAIYNAEADEFKRFTLGEVTVTDPNDYVRMESDKATDFGEFFTKLQERCGGYITFSDNGAGGRQVNWLAEIGTQSSQAIEFGVNLLEFARDGQTSDLATAIVPYGAKLEDGSRVTIASVTEDGKDWIKDDEAEAQRGLIFGTQTWDDVTQPENLLRKAKQWLAEHRLVITSLQLTAADMSRLGANIDKYHIGDRIPVRSKPHELDDYFQLTDLTTDWLDFAGSKVSLGKTQSSLTGADVAGDRLIGDTLLKVKHEIISDYTVGIAQAVQEAQLTLSSLIDQQVDSIRSEVSETYVDSEGLTSKLSTTIEQLKNIINLTFTSLETKVEEVDGEARTKFTEIEKYIRFDGGDIILGEVGNDITLRIENDRISFLDKGAEVAYINNKQLYITDGHFLNSLRLGSFAFVPRENGNLSLVKVVQ